MVGEGLGSLEEVNAESQPQVLLSVSQEGAQKEVEDIAVRVAERATVTRVQQWEQRVVAVIGSPAKA